MIVKRFAGLAISLVALVAAAPVLAGTVVVGPDDVETAGIVVDDGDSFSNAGVIDSPDAAVMGTGDMPNFVNAAGGYIAAPVIGVVILGDVEGFDNAGTIQGGIQGGVIAAGTIGTLGNSGYISGEPVGFAAAVIDTATNSGTISGEIGLLSGVLETLDNQAGGVIGGAIFGVSALQMTSLNNDGTISGGFAGVSVRDIGEVTNRGVIDGGLSAMNLGTLVNSGALVGDLFGLAVTDHVGFIANTGDIVANGDAVTLFKSDANTVFVNLGYIGVTGNEVVCGCPADGVGVVMQDGTLVNSGVVTGDVGIMVGYGDNEGGLEIVNSGLIQGDSGMAIDFGAGGSGARDDILKLLTGGQIVGTVDFGAGTDTLDLSEYRQNLVLDALNLENIVTDLPYVYADDTAVVVDDSVIQAAMPMIHEDVAGTLFRSLDSALADPQRSLWVTAYGGQSSLGDAVTHDIDGLVLGGQAQVWGNTTLGVLASFGHSAYQSTEPNQTLDGDLAGVGLYGRTDLGTVVLDYALLAGSGRHDSTREMLTPSGGEFAYATLDSTYIAPQLGVTLPLLSSDQGSVGLHGNLRYIAGTVAAYQEELSFYGMDVGKQDFGILDARVGLVGNHDFAFGNGNLLSLSGSVGVLAQSRTGSDVALTMLDTEVLSPGGTTTALGGYAELNLTAAIKQSASIGLSLNGELRNDAFSAVGAKLSVTAKF